MSALAKYRAIDAAIQRATRRIPADDLTTRLELSLALRAARELAQVEQCPCCGAESTAYDLIDISTDGPPRSVCAACAARLVEWQVSRSVVASDDLPFVPTEGLSF